MIVLGREVKWMRAVPVLGPPRRFWSPLASQSYPTSIPHDYKYRTLQEYFFNQELQRVLPGGVFADTESMCWRSFLWCPSSSTLPAAKSLPGSFRTRHLHVEKVFIVKLRTNSNEATFEFFQPLRALPPCQPQDCFFFAAPLHSSFQPCPLLFQLHMVLKPHMVFSQPYVFFLPSLSCKGGSNLFFPRPYFGVVGPFCFSCCVFFSCAWNRYVMNMCSLGVWLASFHLDRLDIGILGGFKFEAMFAGVALQAWCPVIRRGSGRSWSKATACPYLGSLNIIRTV